MRHRERLVRVSDVAMRLDGEFHTLCINVTLPGGVKKALELSEAEASVLGAAIADRLAERPAEGRKARYMAAWRARSKA